MGEDFGWKQVQGDVFRFPSYTPVFASLIGTGVQLAVMVGFIIVLSIIGDLYASRGAVTNAGFAG